MTYTAITPKVDGDPITASDWNQIVSNFGAGIPGLFTAKGDLAIASAANTAVVVPVGADYRYLVADDTTASGVKWGFYKNNYGASLSYEGASTYFWLTESTWVDILFLNELWDIDGNATIDIDGNTTYSVAVGQSGYYYIGMQVTFKFNRAVWTNYDIMIGLSVDGTPITVISSDDVGVASTATTENFGEYMLNGSDIIYITAPATIRFIAYGNSDYASFFYLSAEYNPIRSTIIRLE